MTNTKESWEELRSKIEGLGLKLKYHLEAERDDDDDDDGDNDEHGDDRQDVELEEIVIDDPDDDPDKDAAAGAGYSDAGSEADGGPGAFKDLSSLLDGIEKFVEKIDDAFEALGSAGRDEAVRSDVRDIAESLRNAVAATWHDAGADVRDILKTRKRPRTQEPPLVGEIIDPEAGEEESDV